MVKTQDGVLRKAEHLFSEKSADIALLRLVEPETSLQHATLGDSDRLAVGQEVFAIGSPYGLENTLSAGRISAFREFGQLYDGTIEAEFVQTDAAINSGNSGGPLFDSMGRVVGINSRIYTVSGGSQGLGFAVAVNTAKQLLALEDRLWLGFESVFLEAETLRSLFQIDLDSALLVQSVTPNGPADRAGLRGGHVKAEIAGSEILLGGDLILAIGPQETCHTSCLVHSRTELRGKTEIRLSVLRGGEEVDLVVDVSESRRNFLEQKGLDTH